MGRFFEVLDRLGAAAREWCDRGHRQAQARLTTCRCCRPELLEQRALLSVAPVLFDDVAGIGQIPADPLHEAYLIDSLQVSVGPYVQQEGVWLDFNVQDGLDVGAQAEVALLSSSSQGLTGQVTVPGVWLEPVALGELGFTQLSIPECGYTNSVGEPQLPVIRQTLAVPDGVAITAQMTGTPRHLSMPDMGLDYAVVPRQASREKVAGLSEATTADINQEVYASDAATLEAGVQVVELGTLDGQRLVMLEVFPITYNPVQEELTVYDTLSFKLDFQGTGTDSGTVFAAGAEQSGQSAAGDDDGAADKGPGRLLIIAHQDFADELDDYVEHKDMLGWIVDLVDTTTTGTTNTQIRNYIISRYDNPATSPDAVLLVGDTDRIPCFVGLGSGTPPTDLYYGCMDGGDDWYPELPVGRFSVANSTELANVVEKTVAYETSSPNDWTSHAVFMAGDDHYQLTEGTHNWVIANYMDPLAYTSDRLYEVTYDATTQDVRNSFNAGCVLGIYSGHGSITYWADGPAFYQTDVRGLTNSGMYPLVGSFACDTGNYTAAECFMETWLRTADKGAVVAVGSSVSSYWDEDDILEKRLFDAIYDEGYAAFGAAWLRAKELFLDYYGPTATTRRYFEMYNVMGDPTVEVIELPLGITSPSDLPLAYEDQPYQYTLEANGGTAPYSWALIDGELPAGLTLNGGTGVISGTPTTVGGADFTIEVTDDALQSDSREFHLDVVEPLVITTPAELPDAVWNLPYSQTLAAEGGSLPYAWALIDSELPAGLTLNGGSGLLSGTPTELGTFEFTCQVQDSGTPQQSDAKEFTLEVVVLPELTVSLPTAATEGDGLLSNQGMVSVALPVNGDTPVWLACDDTSEVTLLTPTTTILSGHTSATFSLQIEDDAVLDGTQTARITCSAEGYYDGTAKIAVYDNETATLTVSVPASALEGAGVLVGQGTVSVSATPASDVVVNLSTDDADAAVPPPTVTIPAGENSVTFDLSIIDDTEIDGTQVAAITAHVENWTDGSDTIDVLDDDAYLSVLLPTKVWEGQGTLADAGTVIIGGTLPYDLEVSLASNDIQELVLPETATIPAGLTSATFDLIVQDDSDCDGSQPVLVTATATGLTEGSDTVVVGDNDVHHFAISPIADPQTASVPFAVTITAKDINDETIEVYSGAVELTAAGDSGSVPIEVVGSGKTAASDALLWAPAAVDPSASSRYEAALPLDLGSSLGEKTTLGVYHDYAALTMELASYAAAYPAICQLVSIGQSVEGRELWAMKITDNPTIEEDEPEVKYVSTMHGDEPVGTEMCLYFIDLLLGSYGTDPRITNLVDETEIWILPLMNPDGREVLSRYNANGLDLNRNFPEGSSTPIGNILDGPPMDTAGRQPETVAVMEWSAAQSFSLSANFHTGALVVNYPYDNDGMGSVFSPTPDEDLFVYQSEAYSVHNVPMWNNPAFFHGITNGADWYTVSGGMQDWHYRYLGCNEVTIELSNIPRPLESALPGLWADNQESMLSYFETVQMGVRGLVTDALSGDPVFGSVIVAGNSHPVFTDPDVGDYHRMLLPGTYDLTFSAPGYLSQTIQDVSVTDAGATVLSVALVPLGAGVVLSAGQWSGEVAVNAVDTNVVLTADDGQGHSGESNAFDVVPGAVDHFAFSEIPSPQFVDTPFSVTITALDANGYTATGFGGSIDLSGLAGSGVAPTIVISELDPGSPDAIEFTNVSGEDIDISDWQIVVYDGEYWPDPVSTITIPSGTMCGANELFVLMEYGTAPGVYPYFRTGTNIFWDSLSEGAVLLLDSLGQPVDFVCVNGAEPSAITDPMSIPPDQWQGDPVPEGSPTYQRVGNADSNSAGDWVIGEYSIGALNPGMTLPFSGSYTAIAITPLTSGSFVDGVWTGEVTVLELASQMYLRADADEGRTGESNLFDVNGNGTIAGRHVFYNNSSWDGKDPAANEADDNAIAPDKVALLPEELASFDNYTSYALGINGVMVDIQDLPEGTPTASDFVFKVGNDNDPSGWTLVTATPTIDVRRGQGSAGSDRVTIIWPDNAIQNQWLQVTVLATVHTGLAADYVFYFGNAIAEAGNSDTSARVDATDILFTRNNPRPFFNPAEIDCRYDFDRDGRVDAYDLLIVRNHQTTFFNELELIDLRGKGATQQDSTSQGSSGQKASQQVREPQRISLHDAALAQTLDRQSVQALPALNKLDWVYQLDQPDAGQRLPRPRERMQEALDLLMALE